LRLRPGWPNGIVQGGGEANKRLLKTLGLRVSRDMEDLTFFVSWDLEKNRPKVMVDGSGISFDSLWIA
jgi:hypothetical protein